MGVTNLMMEIIKNDKRMMKRNVNGLRERMTVWNRKAKTEEEDLLENHCNSRAGGIDEWE